MANMFRHHIVLVFPLILFFASTEAGILDLKKLLRNVSDSDSDEFSILMDKLKFSFSNPSEVLRRFDFFKKAKADIEGFKAKYKNIEFGVNQFSVMSLEEKQKFLSKPIPESRKLREKRSALNNIFETTTPVAFDFRDYGKVSSIKDQKQCGSCYAHATAAATESQYLLRYNLSLDLSEQNIVSCDTSNYGCIGGREATAFDYIKTNGISTEQCYPYSATNGTCTTACNNQKYFIGGYRNFGNDETTFATQIYNYGPATFGFYVPDPFMSYKSGIIEFPNSICDPITNVGGHAMVIVGYTSDYWIAKNSWGTLWGEDGFVRIKRGKNFCGFTTYFNVLAPYLNLTSSSTVAPVTIPSTTTTTTTTPTTSKVPTTPPATTISPPLISNCAAGDGIYTMNDYQRGKFLDFYNGKRSELAKGTFVMLNGSFAPPAQNMKKLKYNCELENAISNALSTANNSFWYSAYGFALTSNNIDEGYSFASLWTVGFNALSYGNATVYTTLYESEVNFVWDEQTDFACYRNPSMNLFACAITPYHPQTYGSGAIYTTGLGCTADSHCTKPGYNKCEISSKLCTTLSTPTVTTTTIPTTTTATPPSFSECAAGDGIYAISDSQRTRILDFFNGKRSELAKGTFVMINGSFAPSAQNMLKLRYSCELENALSNPTNSFWEHAYGFSYSTYNINNTLFTFLNSVVGFNALNYNNATVYTTEYESEVNYVWDEQTEIACYRNNITSLLSCAITPIHPKSGGLSGAIYTTGPGCTADSQCTKPGYNKCEISSKLCTTLSTPTVTTTTIIPYTTSTTPQVINGCIEGDGITTMNTQQRYNVLSAFNGKRSAIAKGTFTMRNGILAPAAANMKKLKYNCQLENAGYNYIKTGNATAFQQTAGNVYSVPVTFGNNKSINDSINFYTQFVVGFIGNQQGSAMMVTQADANFVSDKQTDIACAFTNSSIWNSPSVMICLISPWQPQTSTSIYTIGNGCTSDAQCTEPGYNKCEISTKLCYST